MIKVKLDMIQLFEFFSEVLICDNVIDETIVVFENKKNFKNLEL